jgi:hypothetical protein
LNSLERFYRWSNNWGAYLGWGSSAWLSRFLLPAVPLLILACVLFALAYRLGGAIAMGVFMLWGAAYAVLALRDIGSDVVGLIRRVFR